MMGPHHCQIRALCPREWNTALHHRQPSQSVPTAVQLSWHPCRPSAPSRRTCAVCLSRLISISLAVSEHRSSWAAHVPTSGGVWMSVIQQLCSSSLSGVDSGLSRGVLRASSQLPTVSLALVGAAVYLMSSYVAVAGGSGYWICPCPSGTRSWLAHPGSGALFQGALAGPFW